MIKRISTLLATILLAAGSTTVLARGGNDGAATGGSASQALSGGQSAGHLSTQGSTNTNGPNAAERATGMDRATKRMNEAATDHSRAGDALLKDKASPGKAMPK